MSEQNYPAGATEAVTHGTPSPSSVTDTQAIEETGGIAKEGSKEPCCGDQFKVPGLHPSMSVSDLVTHLGNCISEQMTSGNPVLLEEASRSKDILEELSQYLLSDSQFSSTSDEQRLMSRVDSLCCLLQRDSTPVQNSQVKAEACFVTKDESTNEPNSISEPTVEEAGDFPTSGEEPSDSGCRQPAAMSRKDSLGDLLLHLPRISSLPQFLFNIMDDVDDQES